MSIDNSLYRPDPKRAAELLADVDAIASKFGVTREDVLISTILGGPGVQYVGRGAAFAITSDWIISDPEPEPETN